MIFVFDLKGAFILHWMFNLAGETDIELTDKETDFVLLLYFSWRRHSYIILH